MAEYLRPRSLDEAVALAARPGAVLAAGCTDLFPAQRGPFLEGSVVSLTAIPGLDGISRTPGGWRIGAATRWAAIAHADLPPAFDGLRAAAREVGSVQIQNAGTIGGNLCNASPAADGVPPLLTLGAEVELTSAAGRRRLPVGEFLLGVRRTALGPGEVMTAVIVPEVAGRGGFLKLGARRYLVISIAMVAARIEASAGRVTAAALAVGACNAVAVRLPEQEAALVGTPLKEAAARVQGALIAPALAPIDDIRADAGYRAEAACELVARLVGQVAGAMA